jgi:tetratricopeptide (TPR) repeat protein
MGAWIAAILTGTLSWWLFGRPRAAHPGHQARRALRVALAGGALIAVVWVTSFMVAQRARPFIVASTHSRLVYVQGAWNVLRARPAAGTGIGTFGTAYRALMPREPAEGEHSAQHAHNTLLEIAVELGAIGLGCFLLFIWRVSPLVRNAPSALERGLGVGLAGFFIHSLLEQTFVEAITAPFWWMVLGLLTGARSLESRPASPARHNLFGRFAMGAAGVAILVTASLLRADLYACQGALRGLSGEHEAAAIAFTQAQRWDPLASRYALEAGEHLLRAMSGRSLPEQHAHLDGAQRQFERTVELSPWFGYAWMRLGVIRWQLGHVDRALAALREAVTRDPNSRAAAAQLGQLLLEQGRHQELVAAAQRLQRLEPQDPRGWFLEALAWQRLGEPARARQAYDALVTRQPAYHPAWFNLAALQDQAGDIESAARAYQMFLNVAPEDQHDARSVAENYLKKHGKVHKNFP